MRKAAALLPFVLVACGEEEPAAPVEKAWSWSASGVTAAAPLPTGEIFVGREAGAEAGASGVFLDEKGKELAIVELAPICTGCESLAPTQPVVVGEYAFIGAPGSALLRIEPARRSLRHLPIENPLGLALGTVVPDGRHAATMTNGTQMLLPGGGLVEVSQEAIVTATHRPADPEVAFTSLRSIAHLEGESYLFVKDSGLLGTWDEVEGSYRAIPTPATRIAGGDGFTVVAVPEAGQITLRLASDLQGAALGPAFAHEIELAVAPGAQRIVVGITDTAVEAPAGEEPAEGPAPGRLFFLDGSGAVIGEATAPAAIRAVAIDPAGTRAVVAHAAGVTAFDIR